MKELRGFNDFLKITYTFDIGFWILFRFISEHIVTIASRNVFEVMLAGSLGESAVDFTGLWVLIWHKKI